MILLLIGAVGESLDTDGKMMSDPERGSIRLKRDFLMRPD
jgi:hypothetical protein